MNHKFKNPIKDNKKLCSLLNKNKKKIIMTLSCFALLLVGCGSIIYAMPETSVTNEFETGIVDIKLNEYQIKDNKEVAWDTAMNILPGQTISKIPRIHNNGNDCYIRVKVEFNGTQEELEDDIFGINDNWVKKADGYYYYNDILETNESVDFFQGIKIPKDFSQEAQEETFYLDIDVDAIQSKNFLPDFNSSQPWGDIHIIECKTGEYDVTLFKKGNSKKLNVEYQGDIEQLITNEKDFFTNFSVMLPGDIYEDSIDLINNGNNDIKLYFRSEALNNTELLEKITLEISTEINNTTELVYKGPLKATELSENILLGQLPKNSSGKLNFKIEVPAELDNEYSILSDYVKWIFSTELIESKPIRTGDSKVIGAYLILAGVSLITLVTVYNTKRGEVYNEI